MSLLPVLLVLALHAALALHPLLSLLMGPPRPLVLGLRSALHTSSLLSLVFLAVLLAALA